jgi:hypothetical protein
MGNRTDTYELARAYLAEHHEAHGVLPSGRELAKWFQDTHDRYPSSSTLHKAIRQFKQSLSEQGTAVRDANDPALAWAASIRAQADAAATAKFNKEREAIETAAQQRVDAAEQRAIAAEQVAAGVREDTTKKLRDAGIRESELRRSIEEQRAAENERALRDQTTIATLNDKVTAQTVAVQVAESNLRHEAEARRIERDNLQTAYDTLRKERAREQSEAVEREARSAEQFRELSRTSGMEISRQRDKIAELEKALLAARVERDEAVTQTRRDITEAIAAQLKELAVAVGGVNQVHNAHMGGLRTQIEQAIARLDELSILLHHPNNASDPVLPAQSRKKGRK